jgi:hypothetical protein
VAGEVPVEEVTEPMDRPEVLVTLDAGAEDPMEIVKAPVVDPEAARAWVPDLASSANSTVRRFGRTILSATSRTRD